MINTRVPAAFAVAAALLTGCGQGTDTPPGAPATSVASDHVVTSPPATEVALPVPDEGTTDGSTESSVVDMQPLLRVGSPEVSVRGTIDVYVDECGPPPEGEAVAIKLSDGETYDWYRPADADWSGSDVHYRLVLGYWVHPGTWSVTASCPPLTDHVGPVDFDVTEVDGDEAWDAWSPEAVSVAGHENGGTVTVGHEVRLELSVSCSSKSGSATAIAWQPTMTDQDRPVPFVSTQLPLENERAGDDGFSHTYDLVIKSGDLAPSSEPYRLAIHCTATSPLLFPQAEPIDPPIYLIAD